MPSPDKFKIKVYKKKREESLLSLGCCVSCGKIKTDFNLKLCADCDEKQVWYDMKRNRGLSKVDYFNLVELQNFKCALCLINCDIPSYGSQSSRIFRVDHDSKTNIIRGFLCHYCNVTLGGFKDDLYLINNTYNNLKNYLIT